MSEQQRSNNLLNQAIQAYKRYLAFGDDITDHAQFRKAAERCIERMRFMGKLDWLSPHAGGAHTPAIDCALYE